ncbi:MAG: PDZ domain-containing protein [Planctomycetes bacterium]|nr:PDZ domain-containing protein [Planctomycetota bacterium]
MSGKEIMNIVGIGIVVLILYACFATATKKEQVGEFMQNVAPPLTQGLRMPKAAQQMQERWKHPMQRMGGPMFGQGQGQEPVEPPAPQRQRQQPRQPQQLENQNQGGWSWSQPLFPIAQTTQVQRNNNPPGINKPMLVKQLGLEMAPSTGGKVRVNRVMGASWAMKAGLQPGDVILSFNRKSVKSVDHFQRIISALTPEMDYSIKILRNDRAKKLLVTVGEGDMTGFAPFPQQGVSGAQPAAFANPVQNFVCPQCAQNVAPACPQCQRALQRIR